jgi:rRNA-processing protein FCF1
MADSKEVWISDTCIIIDLFNAGILFHLFSLEYTIKTTDFVINELLSVNKNLLSDFDVVVTPSEEMKEISTIRNLHPGLSITDVSVYYHAKKSGWVLITGDNTLRNLALKNKIDVHGVLWILDEFVNSGCITPQTAIDSLDKILNSGGRLPYEECEKMKRKWTREP